MEIFEKKLEDLYSQKPFEKLTADETKYVLQYVSEEEYNNYYKLINGTTIQIASLNLEPDATILENLRQTFKEKHQQKTLIMSLNRRSVFNYRMLLRVASVFILLFIFSIYIYFNNNKNTKTLSLKVKNELPVISHYQTTNEKQDDVSLAKSSSKQIKSFNSAKQKKAEYEEAKDTSLFADDDLSSNQFLGMDVEVELVGLNLVIINDRIPLALDIKIEPEEDIYEELLKIKL